MLVGGSLMITKSLANGTTIVNANDAEDAVDDSDPVRDEHSVDNDEGQGVEYPGDDAKGSGKTGGKDAELVVKEEGELEVADSGESGPQPMELINDPDTEEPCSQDTDASGQGLSNPECSSANEDGSRLRSLSNSEVLVQQRKEGKNHLGEGKIEKISAQVKLEKIPLESKKLDTEHFTPKNSESENSVSENHGTKNPATELNKPAKLIESSELQEPVYMQLGDCKGKELSQESELSESGDTDEPGDGADDSLQDDPMSTALTEVLAKTLTKVVSQVMTRIMKKAVRRVLTQRAMYKLLKKVVTQALTKGLEQSLSKI